MKTIFSYFARAKMGRQSFFASFKILKPLKPLPFIWALIPVKIENAYKQGNDRD